MAVDNQLVPTSSMVGACTGIMYADVFINNRRICTTIVNSISMFSSSLPPGQQDFMAPLSRAGHCHIPHALVPQCHQPGNKRLQGRSTTEPGPSMAPDHGWTTTPSRSPAWTQELENAPWPLFRLWDVFQN